MPKSSRRHVHPRCTLWPTHLRTTLSLGEAGLVSLICFGLPVALSLRSAAQGFPVGVFNDTGMLWLCMCEVSATVAALTYLRMRQHDLRPLQPRPSLMQSIEGLVLGFLAWVAAALATQPFIDGPGVAHLQQMMSGSQLSGAVVVLTAMINGTFEEVFLLGVLTRGLRGFGLSVAIGLPLLLRASYHLYQGPVGMLSILMIGLVLALGYVRNGRLWPPVFAHMLWDVLPFALSGG